MQVLKSDVKSVCPVCFKIIQGKTIDEKGIVYMLKSCKEHGDFKEIVEIDSEFYKACLNTEPYTNTIDSSHFMLPITKKCNLACSFCYYPRENQDVLLKKILKVITDYKGPYISIGGGEPTLNEDIFQIIKHIRKVKKIFFLCTNGIRLADEEYVKRLKKSGVNMIHFPLNGLSDDVLFKTDGKKVLDLKLKALENIKKYKISTTISFLIQKGVNEEEFKKIYEFSLKNNSFIKELRLRATSPAGEFKTRDGYYMSELLDIVCEITRINKKDIILKLSKIKKDKRLCNLNICALFYQEGDEFRAIDWDIKTVKKRHSAEGYLIKMFGEKSSKIIRFIYNSSSRLGLISICKMKPWKKKVWLISKVLSNRKKFKFIRFSLRCWPNKYTLDLGGNEICPSATFNYKGEMMPFCFSHIYNEACFKKLEKNLKYQNEK